MPLTICAANRLAFTSDMQARAVRDPRPGEEPHVTRAASVASPEPILPCLASQTFLLLPCAPGSSCQTSSQLVCTATTQTTPGGRSARERARAELHRSFLHSMETVDIRYCLVFSVADGFAEFSLLGAPGAPGAVARKKTESCGDSDAVISSCDVVRASWAQIVAV